MKQITNKEYEEFQKYKKDKLYGRLLTSEGLRLICAAENYNPEAIGKRMLEELHRIESRVQ
ncbi:MAG: cytochrome C [Eubacteriales bacterium]|nr:cytochrome C [Eubacteriales bacterium]